MRQLNSPIEAGKELSFGFSHIAPGVCFVHCSSFPLLWSAPCPLDPRVPAVSMHSLGFEPRV